MAITNSQYMREMEDVVKQFGGFIVARCRRDRVGLILQKTTHHGKTTYLGRRLDFSDINCECRILQVKDGRLSKAKWQSHDPLPIGFLPIHEVQQLLNGQAVTRGCD